MSLSAAVVVDTARDIVIRHHAGIPLPADVDLFDVIGQLIERVETLEGEAAARALLQQVTISSHPNR